MFGAWGTKHEPTWALRQLLLFFGSNISNSSPLSCWSLQRKKWSFKGSRLDLKIRERERERSQSHAHSQRLSAAFLASFKILKILGPFIEPTQPLARLGHAALRLLGVPHRNLRAIFTAAGDENLPVPWHARDAPRRGPRRSFMSHMFGA